MGTRTPSELYEGGGAWKSTEEDTQRFKDLGEGLWLYVALFHSFHLPMNLIH